MPVNLAERIKKYFPDDIASLIRSISSLADDLNYRIYLIGGIVRDLILELPAHDIDILVEGDAEHLASLLSPLMGISPIIHKKFNTSTFKHGTYRIDFSTCRSEIYKHPGALPDTQPGTLADDLARRDFTVNSMAICLNQGRFGELIDIKDGMSDLKNGIIRILHDGSFIDDATRIMRAIRYEQRLGFSLEKNTQHLLISHLDKLDTISKDRLRHEFILWLSEAEPEKIIARADQLGVLRKLHHSLSVNKNLAELFNLARNTNPSSSLIYSYLTIIIYNLDPLNLQELLYRLNIEGGTYYRIATHTISLKNNLTIINTNSIEPAEIYFFLKDFDITAIRTNLIMTSLPFVQANLRLYLEKLRRVKTHLGGDYLINLGISEGQQLGNILKSILTAQLNGKITTLSEEQSLAKKLAERFLTKGMDQ